jgi:hypothetical protein
MPSGTRISEPVSTGMAVSRPNSVALRLRVFLIGMPITPNIIHTMKHTVKASVLTISTDMPCPLLSIILRPWLCDGRTLGLRGRERHPLAGGASRRRRTTRGAAPSS